MGNENLRTCDQGNPWMHGVWSELACIFVEQAMMSLFGRVSMFELEVLSNGAFVDDSLIERRILLYHDH
jgi:hypothetical protein